MTVTAESPPQIVCTLYEGNYAYGVAALINSLHAAGFAGTVRIGHRGPLPFWTGQCRAHGDGRRFAIGTGIELEFVRLETSAHLANYKPQFLLDTLDSATGPAPQVYYFDPDIILICDWSFVRRWADGAVALCADINDQCPSTHPVRRAWRSFFAARGVALEHPRMELYVNSGFIGVSPACRGLLEEWLKLQELVVAEIGGGQVFINRDRSFIFHNPDQDALNAALERCTTPISVVGREGMDFGPGGYVMSHAVGQPKPWTKPFVLRALHGSPPTLQDKRFLGHVSSPLRLWGPGTTAWKRISAKIGALIGRFMRRS
jgi:hypothetical protein